jgi:hypothetical protein
MSAASDEQTPEPSNRRLAFLVATLVGIEALLLLAGAGFLIVEAATSDGGNLAAGVALAAIVVVVGAGLAICARGVLGGSRWTRGPVLTWQLLQAGVAMPLSTTKAWWWVGVLLLAVSIVVGALIVGRHVIPRPRTAGSDSGLPG